MLGAAFPRLTNTFATAYSPAVEAPPDGPGGQRDQRDQAGRLVREVPGDRRHLRWRPVTGNRASFRGFWPLAHALWSRMLRSPRLSVPSRPLDTHGDERRAFRRGFRAYVVRASPPVASNVTPSSAGRLAAATNTRDSNFSIVTPSLGSLRSSGAPLDTGSLDHGAMRVQRRSRSCLRRFAPRSRPGMTRTSRGRQRGSRTRWSRVCSPTSRPRREHPPGAVT